jgi:hypothetical protein
MGVLRPSQPASLFYDLNMDGATNHDDVDELVLGILGSQYADASLNGKVDAVAPRLLRLHWHWKRPEGLESPPVGLSAWAAAPTSSSTEAGRLAEILPGLIAVPVLEALPKA